MAELSYTEIVQLLKYDAETGKLYWLERPVEMFSNSFLGSKWAADKWNTRYAGKEALTAYDTGGYRYGNIFKKPYRAHRVAWVLHTGEWPLYTVDHINGVRDDNRIENLRDVTHADNCKNSTIRSDNESGVVGVRQITSTGMWRARIYDNGKEIHLGHFHTLDEAITARKEAETIYGYHELHGKPR